MLTQPKFRNQHDCTYYTSIQYTIATINNNTINKKSAFPSFLLCTRNCFSFGRYSSFEIQFWFDSNFRQILKISSTWSKNSHASFFPADSIVIKDQRHVAKKVRWHAARKCKMHMPLRLRSFDYRRYQNSKEEKTEQTTPTSFRVHLESFDLKDPSSNWY